MGLQHPGLPHQWALFIRDQFNIDCLVETGTFYGKSALWASDHFAKVITIEAQPSLYQHSRAILSDRPNTQVLCGDSRQILPEIVNTLDKPALFWLDDHWCVGKSFGQNDECPILEELNILRQSKLQHFLLIDDARYFLSPPPSPHDLSQWPTIDKLLAELQNVDPPRYITIYEDVILSAPDSARDKISKYLQNAATDAWRRSRREREATNSQKSIENSSPI